MTATILSVPRYEQLREQVGCPKGHIMRLGDTIVLWDAFRDKGSEDVVYAIPLDRARLSWSLPLFTVKSQ